MSQVKVPYAANGGALTTVNEYGFATAEKEISTTRAFSYTTEFNSLLTFEYYQTSSAARRKKNYTYWLRSLGISSGTGNTNSGANVRNSDGALGSSLASNVNFLSFAFAF